MRPNGRQNDGHRSYKWCECELKIKQLQPLFFFGAPDSMMFVSQYLGYFLMLGRATTATINYNVLNSLCNAFKATSESIFWQTGGVEWKWQCNNNDGGIYPCSGGL